jgi:hypothetical protein
MARVSLDTKFTKARDNFKTALDHLRETERVAGAYSTAFQNPYGTDLRDARAYFDSAVNAFGPLMKEAIEANHHGRWIYNRLPGDFCLIVTQDHRYGCRVFATDVSSGVSNRDVYVEWPI